MWGMNPSVYFFQSPSTGLVKIGSSVAVPKRYDGVCRENRERLVLLGTFRGASLEDRFHTWFRHRWVAHEWFLPDELLSSMIADSVYVKPPRVSSYDDRQPLLVHDWLWYSYQVRRVLAGIPPYHNQRWHSLWRDPKDPNPLPLPCCPMLEPARSLSSVPSTPTSPA